MLKQLWAKIGGRAHLPEELTYADARDILERDNARTKRELADRSDTPPEMLYYLAEEKSADVRTRVAANPTTPHKADDILVDDAHDEVRAELARKLGRIVPDLNPDDQTQLREQAIALIEKLAQDQAPKVRQIISEAIKSSESVPHHIVKKLAKDVELAVCGPVLEFSPMLSDADLVEVVAACQVEGALAAIANRQDLSEEVCDSVAATLDVPAVATLIANPNAKIREETLQEIVENAEEVEAWHKPLVMRSELSIRMMRRVATFVVHTLVEEMAKRHNLDSEITRELTGIARERIKDAVSETSADADGDTPREVAIRAFEEGHLNAEFVSDAIEAGSRDLVVYSIALLGNIPVTAPLKAFEARSGKGITALCWKAGLSMRIAVDIQTKIAKVPASERVNARAGVDNPMAQEELDFYLSYFCE